MKINGSLIAAVKLITVGVSAFCPQTFVPLPKTESLGLNTPPAHSPSSRSDPSLLKLPPNRFSSTQLHYRKGFGDSNYLLNEFRTANGEIINPYRVLKVSRNADRKEIRQSYRMLSKKYHPDGARFREVLPGNWYVSRFPFCILSSLYFRWAGH